MAAKIANNGQENKINRANTSIRRLLWAGPLTAVLAGAANIIVREIAVVLGTIPADLFILQEPGVFISTFVQVLLGAAVFALIIKFARQPVRSFRIVAVIALLLSLTNPVMVANGMMPIGATISTATMLSMMVMHIVAGAIAFYLLPRLAREE
jgi:hypothetical protein